MKGMKKYYTQKIMWYLLTLVFAVLLNFILPRLMPGDPVSTIASKSVEGMTDATAIQKVYEDYAAKFGINKPMYVQFFTWVKNALRGDFGISFSQYPRTVSDIISSSVLWTICLQLPAIIVGWILGNLLGAIAAYMKGVFDKAILPAFLFISNVPAFGMATVLLFVFSLKLHIAPAAGGYASSMIPHMSLAFEFSDPSYHLPHFYELFALWADPCDHEFWKKAADASRKYLHTACHFRTGLSAEYADYDGTPHAQHQEIFGRHDWYYSDAYRTIANIGMDHLWFDADPWQTENANKLQQFYCEEQAEHWDGVFLTDGTRLEEKALHPTAIIAVNAQASLAADGPYAEKCVRRFWNTPLRTGERRYYDNFLYLFAMLALSGNYRIYR